MYVPFAFYYTLLTFFDEDPGDSGAWVLDPASGAIHGITVATCSDLGFTYAIPAQDVFTSIRERVGVVENDIDVMLPTRVSVGELNVSFFDMISKGSTYVVVVQIFCCFG